MPDSRHVVFSLAVDLSQPTRLCMGDTRTGRFWPLLLGARNSVTEPAVAPDGKRIAFDLLDRRVDIVEVPIGDGPPRTLIERLCDYGQMSLSADGRKLIYVGNARGSSEVWLRDMTNGSDRLLVTRDDIAGTTFFSNPELSRDQRHFVVTVWQWGRAQGMDARVYVGLVSGGAPVQASAAEGVEGDAATWSPDGDRLAYLRGNNAIMSLELTRIDGAEPPTQLVDTCGYVVPAWSPTGQWIAAADFSRLRIVLVSPDGRTRQTLPADPGWSPSHLCWSPDGRLLYVIALSLQSDRARWEVASVEVETGRWRHLRDLGLSNPADHGPAAIRISATPDNKAIVYSEEHFRGEIWLLEGVQSPKPWYARLVP
jgi:Tol biopolymer transport system component